jgi:hypothetical protein
VDGFTAHDHLGTLRVLISAGSVAGASLIDTLLLGLTSVSGLFHILAAILTTLVAELHLSSCGQDGQELLTNRNQAMDMRVILTQFTICCPF